MFNKNTDDRLSTWLAFREQLENSNDPFQDTCEFWKNAPFIPYNHNIDPFNRFSWPSPWEIIVNNKYDDFTKALMIGFTIKFTKKFKNTPVEIRTLVDNTKTGRYNIVLIDNMWVLNFDEDKPILFEKISDSFLLENLIELSYPW